MLGVKKMNNRDELMNELKAVVNSGNLLDVSDEKLEEYFSAIIAFASTSGEYFTPFQYPQVCEALRLLLMKKYTEKIDKQNSETQANNLKLQEQNVNLQSQNNRLQKLIIFLMVLTIAMAGLQIYVTLRPNQQLQQQIELLKGISLQQKAAPTVQTTDKIHYDNPQKKTSQKEMKQ
jgi:hypothetical protein